MILEMHYVSHFLHSKSVDVKCFQLMSFLFCYASLVLISNVKTRARKVLILDNNANEIIALKKHVYVNHCMIANIFGKKN